MTHLYWKYCNFEKRRVKTIRVRCNQCEKRGWVNAKGLTKIRCVCTVDIMRKVMRSCWTYHHIQRCWCWRYQIERRLIRWCLFFFGNKVVYVPKIMGCLLVRQLDEETQRFLEVAMVNLIQRGVENEYKHIHESLIDSIIRQKISNKFKYASRSNSKIMKNVYFSFQNFRCRRMEEESHLPMIFYQDLQRSLGELKYCFTLTLKSEF